MADEYHIRIREQLDPAWSAWFDGLTVVKEADGNTLLAGLVVDQAALHGILMRVRDLGLTLLAVNVQHPSAAPHPSSCGPTQRTNAERGDWGS
jgi:hypothetical protein